VGFRRLGGERIWSGRIFSVDVDRFEHDEGRVARREIVRHPGAAAVLPHDGERLYMVRQPREAAGEQGLLEVVAGRLDAEPPLATARRELAEEVGKGARSWRPLRTFFSVAGFSDERVHLFLATDLYDVPQRPEPGERVEVCSFPLDRLDDAVAACSDGRASSRCCCSSGCCAAKRVQAAEAAPPASSSATTPSTRRTISSRIARAPRRPSVPWGPAAANRGSACPGSRGTRRRSPS
jgi:8-oxo-dGTP pyrophosphatase MutT (NUDIX family)